MARPTTAWPSSPPVGSRVHPVLRNIVRPFSFLCLVFLGWFSRGATCVSEDLGSSSYLLPPAGFENSQPVPRSLENKVYFLIFWEA